jgi:hypothetical protein
MLYSEIIAVCSEIHTKHINTLCGQNVEFVNVKTRGTYAYHSPLRCVTPLLGTLVSPKDAVRLLHQHLLFCSVARLLPVIRSYSRCNLNSIYISD